MKILLTSPEELGRLIRALRKAERVRQDDVAGAVGVSDVYLGRLENGAPGARLDKAMRVLKQLGVTLQADVRDEVAVKYAELTQRASAISAPHSAAKRKKR